MNYKYIRSTIQSALLPILLVLLTLFAKGEGGRDFATKPRYTDTSVMTSFGDARYITNVAEVPFQRSVSLPLRFRWEPSKPNLDHPLATEWVFLPFESRLERKKDGVSIYLPGGLRRFLKKREGNTYSDKRKDFIGKPLGGKGNFLITCSDKWQYHFKSGYLNKVVIPNAGQDITQSPDKIETTSYTWHLPWKTKDGAGGILNENSQTWVLRATYKDVVGDSTPRLSLSWNNESRKVDLFAQSGDDLNNYFPADYQSNAISLSGIKLNGVVLEQFKYQDTTPEKADLTTSENGKLLRFDHLVAHAHNNYIVFDSNTKKIRRDAHHRYFLNKGRNDRYPQIVKMDNLGNVSLSLRRNGEKLSIDALGEAKQTLRFTQSELVGKVSKVNRISGCVVNLNPVNGSFKYKLGKNTLTTTQNYYNIQNKTLIRKVNEFGQITTYQHKTDPDSGKVIETTTIKPGGIKTTEKFDAKNNVTERLDELGNATLYGYDKYGNEISETSPDGHKTTYEYDQRNNLLKTTFADGSFTSSTYDDFGNLLSVTDEDGHTITHLYNAFNERISTTDALGNVTAYRYDNSEGACVSCGGVRKPSDTTHPNGRVDKVIYEPYSGKIQATIIAAETDLERKTVNLFDDAFNIISTIDPAGSKTTYERDPLGRITSTTNPLGETTKTKYSDGGKVAKVSYPDGNTESREYNERDLLVKSTNRAKQVTTYEYDQAGNVIKITHPGKREDSFTYNDANQLISYTNKAGKTTTYELDAKGQLTKVTHPDGRTESLTYHQGSQPLSHTTSTGAKTEYTYDSRGRRIKETFAFNDQDRSTTFVYSKSGKLLSHTTAGSDLETSNHAFTLDPLGRRLSTTQAQASPQETAQSMTYDTMGNMLSTTDGLGNTSKFEYDLLGQRIKALDARANVTEYEHDKRGNVTLIKPPLQGIIRRDYDQIGRLIKEIDGENRITEYFYDKSGNLAGYLNPAGQRFTFEYDALGKRTKRLEPDKTEQSYNYDASGNLVSRKKADGNTIMYKYNQAGQLISSIWHQKGNTEVTYQYDDQGRLNEIDSKTHNLKYTYDALGNRLSETQTLKGLDFSQTVTYSYNLNRQMTTLSHNELALAYHWGAGGRLSALGTAGRKYQYEYNQAGQRCKFTRPSGVDDLYVYNETNHLTALYTQKGDEILSTKEFGYDEAGRLAYTAFQDGTGNSYGYDKSGQVIAAQLGIKEPSKASVDATTAQYRYFYDEAGNRKETVVKDNRTYEANAVNQYSAINGESVSYDPNGNILIAEGKTYEWNLDNRFTKLTQEDGSIIEYAYDPLGRRTCKQEGDMLTIYLYDGWNVIAEYQGSNSASGEAKNTQFNLSTIKVWGTDLSGSLQGAGGVGGFVTGGKVE